MKKLVIVMLLGVCFINTNTYAGIGEIFGWVDSSINVLSSITNLLGGDAGDSQNIPQQEKPHDVRTVNANMLKKIVDQYEENSIAALDNYEDQWFSFTGVVDSLSTGMAIKTDQWALLWVRMDDKIDHPNENATQCWGNLDRTFAKSLRKGERIAVTGKLTYDDGNQKISFTDCQVTRG